MRSLCTDAVDSWSLECCFNQNSCKTSASKLNLAGNILEPQKTSGSLVFCFGGVGLKGIRMGWCRYGGKLMTSSMEGNCTGSGSPKEGE